MRESTLEDVFLKLTVSVLPLPHSVRILRDTFLGRAADPVNLAVMRLFAAGFFTLALFAVKQVEA